jgi:hypothetical protein
VRQRYRYTVEQSEGNEALFLVPKAVVLERERRAIEHLRRVDKVDAVILQVLQALSLVPLEPHLRSVYTPTAGRNAHFLLPDNAAVERPRDHVSSAPRVQNEMTHMRRARAAA